MATPDRGGLRARKLPNINQYPKRMKIQNAWRTLTACGLCALMACTFTACDDDDDEEGEGGELSEKWDISDMVVRGNEDGTISFEGSVRSAKKLTSFEIEDKVGNKTDLVVKDKKNVDMEEPETVTDEETGKTVKMKYVTSVDGKIDITKGPFKLKCDLRFTKKAEIIIGTAYEWNLGTKDSNNGSYGSFKDGKCYKVDDIAKDGEPLPAMAKCEVKLDKNGDAVTLAKLKANNNLTSVAAAKQTFPGAKISGTTEGTIVTEDGCVATFKMEKATKTIGGVEPDGETYTVSGLRYGTEDGTIKIETYDVNFD